jgi:hypothetical protein
MTFANLNTCELTIFVGMVHEWLTYLNVVSHNIVKKIESGNVKQMLNESAWLVPHSNAHLGEILSFCKILNLKITYLKKHFD